MKRLPFGFCAVVVPIAILLCVPLWAADVSLIGPPDQSALTQPASPSPQGSEETYTGTARLYLVEPVGRWLDDLNQVYYQGFLDFPLIAPVNLDDGEIMYRSASWDAKEDDSIGFILETNIEVIAAVFNSEAILKDAYPPDGYWFNAHYVDASAWATPGNPGTSEPALAGYTHNVFIEEGTRTS
jgi:hypothetical protein